MIALNIQMTLEDEGVTSFDIAATEVDAVAMARVRFPNFISSDVALIEGQGRGQQLRSSPGTVASLCCL